MLMFLIKFYKSTTVSFAIEYGLVFLSIGCHCIKNNHKIDIPFDIVCFEYYTDAHTLYTVLKAQV